MGDSAAGGGVVLCRAADGSWPVGQYRVAIVLERMGFFVAKRALLSVK